MGGRNSSERGRELLGGTKVFNGFAVDDVQRAREFYGDTLGLKVEVLDEQNGLLTLAQRTRAPPGADRTDEFRRRAGS